MKFIVNPKVFHGKSAHNVAESGVAFCADLQSRGLDHRFIYPRNLVRDALFIAGVL